MDNNDSSTDTQKTALLLMGIKGGGKRIPYNKGRDRFNMPFAIATAIRADLNANHIMIGGNNIAIATQYPYPHQLEASFQLLMENRTPALIILASSKDMQKNELPDYFSTSGHFGTVSTRSTFISDIELGDEVREGDVLGAVSNPITNEQFDIVSPHRGRILGMALDQFVMPGFAVYHIGIHAAKESLMAGADNAGAEGPDEEEDDGPGRLDELDDPDAMEETTAREMLEADNFDDE